MNFKEININEANRDGSRYLAHDGEEWFITWFDKYKQEWTSAQCVDFGGRECPIKLFELPDIV